MTTNGSLGGSDDGLG